MALPGMGCPAPAPSRRLPIGQTSEQDLPAPSARSPPHRHTPPRVLAGFHRPRRRPGCQEGCGCQARPSRRVTPPVPETLQALDLSGHPATRRGGSRACRGTEGVWDASEVRLLETSNMRKEEPCFVLLQNQRLCDVLTALTEAVGQPSKILAPLDATIGPCTYSRFTNF